ncbi:MAG: helix-turn-helix domain-containing protein [Schleiferilactobacillus harbinensis]
MLTYGEAFRYFRKNKGLTLKQVADEINSVSLVAQFEKNQSNIAVDRFVHLLEKINVSYNEFQLFRQGHVRSEPEQLIREDQLLRSVDYQIAHGKSRQQAMSTQKIAELAAYQHQHYSLTMDHYLQVMHATLNPASPDHLFAIRHYLHTVDQWGTYEIDLFKLALSQFTPEQTWALLPILHNKTKVFTELPGQGRAVVKAYFTAITGLVANQAYALAEKTWHMAQREVVHEDDVASSVLLPFMLGWIRIYQRQEEEANRLFKQSVAWYRTLGLDHLANTFEDIRIGLNDTAAAGESQFYIFSS